MSQLQQSGPDEQLYYTPDGYVDLPAYYVYDGVNLTDGQNYNNLPVTIEYDSSFILRAILGVPSMVNATGGGFRLSNYSKSRVYSDFIKGYSAHVAVAPEIIYPPNSQILFDLQAVLKAFNNQGGGDHVSTSQIAFQGVKRYKPGHPGYSGPAFPTPYDPSKFIVRPWAYRLPVTLNWNSLALPKTFTVEIQDYDFELHTISVVDVTTGIAPTFDLCRLQVYDQSAKRAMSSPINLTNINYLGMTGGLWAVFPVPYLLYPVWTQLRIDVSSLLATTDPSAPYSLEIMFNGMQRTPRVSDMPGADQNEANPANAIKGRNAV